MIRPTQSLEMERINKVFTDLHEVRQHMHDNCIQNVTPNTIVLCDQLAFYDLLIESVHNIVKSEIEHPTKKK